MNKIRISDRIRYWFDKKLSKGSIRLFGLLTAAILGVMVLIAVITFVFRFNDGSFINNLWDYLAATINAEIPEYDDSQLGYMILSTVAGLVGVLFTSLLIGVISTSIEDKLTSLRKGKTQIYEKDHTVIIGFEVGTYELIRQLILSANGAKRTIVVCETMERDELEDDIYGSVDIPDNVELICRNLDLTNPAEYRIVSLEHAKNAIVNVFDDKKSVACTLAAMTYLRDFKDCETRLVSSVTTGKFLLPENILNKRNCQMIRTNDFIAKLIAHTTTEPGLSVAFKTLLSFEGDEFYFEKADKYVGKTVLDVNVSMDKGVLIGVKRIDEIILNPSADFVISQNDELIVLEENKGAYIINNENYKNIETREMNKYKAERKGEIVIFGYNYKLPTLLEELPDKTKNIVVAGVTESDSAKIKNIRTFGTNIRTELTRNDLTSENILNLVRNAAHVVVISNDEIDSKDDDICNIILMLKLIDFRKTYNLKYNITAELTQENSNNLIVKPKDTDFIIASNVVSSLMAQLAENENLFRVFSELLSNRGNELYVKNVDTFGLHEKDYSVCSLRQIMLSYGFTLIGYEKDNKVFFNPGLNERVNINMDDKLIVLGKD